MKLIICTLVDWIIENPEKWFAYFGLFTALLIVAGVKEWWDEKNAR